MPAPRLRAGGKIRFLKLNVLENAASQELASNFGIMSTLPLLFLCKGRPVGQIVGFASKEDLEGGLNDILVDIGSVCLS
jgi:hypothetical protein